MNLAEIEKELLEKDNISIEVLSNYLGVSEKVLKTNLAVTNNEISTELFKQKVSELADKVFDIKA